MCNSLQPIVGKLEKLFEILNESQFGSELEMPVISVSPDSTRGAFGWCTSWKAWKDRSDMDVDMESCSADSGYYEINITAEYLTRPMSDISGTMLHEMVHLYNIYHDIKDTTRNGTYHNKKFRDAALSFGLTCENDQKYGWCRTSLDEQTSDYLISLGVFDWEFDIYRSKLPASEEKKRKQSMRKYICPSCGLTVRATKKVYVICGDCQEALESETDDESDD